MPNDQTIDQLHRLIQINKEAQAALRTAAQAVKNSELESLFNDYAKQHAKFESELAEELHRLGGTVSTSEAETGAPPHGWFASLTTDIKSALFGHSPAALLSSCESGEESAEIAYQDAADVNPSGQTHTLVDKQWKQIKGFRTHLARLVSETKDGTEFQTNEE